MLVCGAREGQAQHAHVGMQFLHAFRQTLVVYYRNLDLSSPVAFLVSNQEVPQFLRALAGLNEG